MCICAYLSYFISFADERENCRFHHFALQGDSKRDVKTVVEMPDQKAAYQKVAPGTGSSFSSSHTSLKNSKKAVPTSSVPASKLAANSKLMKAKMSIEQKILVEKVVGGRGKTSEPMLSKTPKGKARNPMRQKKSNNPKHGGGSLFVGSGLGKRHFCSNYLCVVSFLGLLIAIVACGGHCRNKEI